MNRRVRYWMKFILGMLIGGAVGFTAGFFDLDFIFEEVKLYIWFEYDIVLLLMGVASVILLLLILIERLRLSRFSTVAEQNQIYSPKEKAVGRLIMYSTILVGLSSLWMICSLSLLIHTPSEDSYEMFKFTMSMVAVAISIISLLLMSWGTHTYNQIFPNRKMDLYSKDYQKDFFNQLDEAEKWMVYIASYRSYVFGTRLILLLESVLLIYSIVVTPQIVAILCLGVVLIAIQIKYFSEVNQLSKDSSSANDLRQQ